MAITTTPGSRMSKSTMSQWTAVAEQAARTLRGRMFDGDFSHARSGLDQYKAQWSEQDPFARFMLRKALSDTSPLAFRTATSSLVELSEGYRSRVEAWMEILPFDLQLALVRNEWRHDNPFSAFRVDDLAWDRWHAFLSAKDPGEFFREGELGGYFRARPMPGSPGTTTSSWRNYATGVSLALRHHAAGLAAHGQWHDFDAWLAAAKIDAWDGMSETYINYRRPSVSGSALAVLSKPKPFWMMGLLNGVVDPMYWEILSRHGGPRSPVLGKERPPRLSRPAGFSPLRRTGSPSDWTDPVSWIGQGPDSLWARDPDTLDAVRQQARAAQAAWRQQALLSTVEQPSAQEYHPPRM